MTNRNLGPRVLGIVCAFVLAAACGGGVGPNGSVVGSSCTTDRDCLNICRTGDDNFPGGYCTRACASDNDCPGGTACIRRGNNENICAVTCRQASDCTPWGRGFTCANRDRASGGEVLVCRVQ